MPDSEAQVIANHNKTTIVCRLKISFTRLLFVLNVFSRCVKGCLEQLRWESCFITNTYWCRLNEYIEKIDLMLRVLDSVRVCQQRLTRARESKVSFY